MENTTSDQSNNSIFKHAIRSGAIMGGISIVITLLVYLVDYSVLVDWKYGLIMIAIFLGLVIYAGINYRTQIGGFISYGRAFQHGFITLAVGGFIGILFSILLYQVIDTEMPQKLTDASVEKTAAMMQSFGAPEDKTEEALDKMRDEMPARFGVLGQIKTYLFALIAYVVISAITSLIVRKNQPMEM